MPIRVNVDEDDNLVVSNGQADSIGFAAMVFADPDEESAFQEWLDNTRLTDLPGLDINDMDTNSGLYLEVLPRPVLGSSPTEHRILWYANPATNRAVVTPNQESLEVLSTRLLGEMTLFQADDPVPAAMQAAEPLTSDLGQHRHVLNYVLDDNPTSATGTFGFFARLTSPAYGPSEPFLVALNNRLDNETFQAGALAINDSAVLTGDYDRDDVVGPSDFGVWLASYGRTGRLAADADRDELAGLRDYILWRDNLGALFTAATAADSSVAASNSVPEPSAVVLLGLAFAPFLVQRSRGSTLWNPQCGPSTIVAMPL